jgi:hypothetical protein
MGTRNGGKFRRMIEESLFSISSALLPLLITPESPLHRLRGE